MKEHIPFKYQPKFSTPLAITGWWDKELHAPICLELTKEASVFYQGVDNSIVNALFECDNKTGNYTFGSGENVISELAGAPSVLQETGLAITKLGDSEGYQLFYHDNKGLVSMLSSTDETDWQYNGPVSRHKAYGAAIAAVHTKSIDVSVVWPNDFANLLVARLNDDSKNKWSLESFPTSFYNSTVTNNSDPSRDFFLDSAGGQFSSFEGSDVSLSIATNTDSELSVFYIGQDAQLHGYSGFYDSWKQEKGPEAKKWPEADDEVGQLAVVSPPGSEEMWIYYTSQGEVVELHRDGGGIWKDAKMPSLTTATNVNPGSNSRGSDDSSGTDSSSIGEETESATDSSSAESLATGAKAGVGIGVGVGVLVLVTAAWFLLRKRRQKTANEVHQSQELQDSGKFELSDTAKFELSDTAKFELPDTVKYELPGDTSYRTS
ncbi:hypothetical protein FSARC_3922 [Fusarium sarcochroum]|uniref:Fucose-specific lectin n=1 Tax=Fusarium sarcochroum TaxID=1208366 RepID=A0A8H4U3C6_9HYPO|nr:hypothetical protein FSARC_3922 [Fusarium sarcochroum]